MFYLVKTPWLIKKIIYPKYIWQLPATEKKIYLTFDDGPHPVATNFVLDVLDRFSAKATFFCIGKNVLAHPGIYKSILSRGHTTGNHTHNHLNGWKVKDEVYLSNILLARQHIHSNLFRPPYGRISGYQAKQVIEKMNFKLVMWSVLSGDFDRKLSPDDCFRNVVGAVAPGAVIVFHDSEKSYPTLRDALPKALERLTEMGYQFEKIVL
jgi:peptidoglycan/xylan/chitin deacetylase (PgdA/CDA1 family)